MSVYASPVCCATRWLFLQTRGFSVHRRRPWSSHQNALILLLLILSYNNTAQHPTCCRRPPTPWEHASSPDDDDDVGVQPVFARTMPGRITRRRTTTAVCRRVAAEATATEILSCPAPKHVIILFTIGAEGRGGRGRAQGANNKGRGHQPTANGI